MNITEMNNSDAVRRKRKLESLDDHPEYKTPKISSFYITLAKESPTRIYDSDDSTYDSFHGKETDVCRDTSDTDSSYNSSDENINNLDVVEYELASTSGSDNYSSSSGDDDIMIAAVAHAIYDDSTSMESDFSILADTEDSDSQTDDPELGKADYWECVKCKNKQNNPLYRYCEKCYQIRKNLFPPRPKNKRKSKNCKKIGNKTTEEDDGNVLKNTFENRIFHSINRKTLDNKQYKGNSAGETTNSDLDETDDDFDTKFFKEKSPIISKKRKCNGRLSVNKRKRHSSNNECLKTRNDIEIIKETNNVNYEENISCENNKINNLLLSNINVVNNDKSSLRKRTCDKISENSNDEDSKNCKRIKLESTNLNVNEEICYTSSSTSEIGISKPSHLNIEKVFNKDSGFSSSSSQDLSPIINEKDLNESKLLYKSSQETYCTEVEENNDKLMVQIPSSQETLYPNSQLTTCESNLNSQSSILSENLQRDSISSSDISDSEFNLKNHSIIPTESQLSSTSNSDGLERCMMCLSEPKNGVFVHNTYLHSCCCYKCAVKIWGQIKRCPICNCKVKNVMKLFVH